MARVRNATQRRALEQAKRVPWQRLAKAADEFIQWHVFTLWVRATVDAANSLPAAVRAEVELRAPGVARALLPRVKSAINRGDRPGSVAWEDIRCWAEMNVFLSARREGWLDAIRYFSDMSLCSMKAWSHWERMDALWRRSPPRQFPMPQEWDSAVASVTQLSNADSVAQRALDVVRGMRESDWDKLLVGFSRLNAFCRWMDLMIAGQDRISERVWREILDRYPEFSFSNCVTTPKETVRCLKSWALRCELPGPKRAGTLAALRFQLRHHPEYAAICNYAQICRGIWADGSSRGLPTFDEWKQAADGYSEAD